MLSVGVSIALCVGIGILVVVFIDLVYFREELSFLQLFLISVLTLFVALLGKSKSVGVLPESFNPRLGFLYCVVSAASLSFAYYFLAIFSREVNPYLAAVVWEVSTGIIVLLMLLLREKFFNVKYSRISKKSFLDITFRCSPAIIGSVLFLYAFSLGSISLASAIRSVYVAFGTVIAYFLFKETPTPKQWILILLIGITVFFLKLLT